MVFKLPGLVNKYGVFQGDLFVNPYVYFENPSDMSLYTSSCLGGSGFSDVAISTGLLYCVVMTHTTAL